MADPLRPDAVAAPAAAPPAPRRADLPQMKRLALALLAGAALLYLVATLLRARHPAWGYVAAFAEAAMVGAVADWFAVVALFRHPLGLPVPHTAIIPANKERIGRELANFICGNFLQTASVVERLRRFAPGARVAGWLATPRHAAAVGEHLGGVARYGLQVFDDERVRAFVGGAIAQRIDRVDLAPLAGRLLEMLTAERRHQALLDAVLRQLAQVLSDEMVHAKIAEGVAGELPYLSYVGLDNVAGRLAARKFVDGVGRLIGEMSENPAHPLRLRFDEVMGEFVQRLQHDPALRERVQGLKADLLGQPALGAYLHGLWDEVLAWLRADLERGDSSVRARIATAARTLGEKLQQDPAMQQWIDAQLLDAAPHWIERYREDIRRYIVEHVDAWDTAQMTDEVERHIGRDLQFVRINGTLVGGLVGLAIYAATRLAGIG